MGKDKRTYRNVAGTLRSGASVLAVVVLSLHPVFAQQKLLPVFDFHRLATANGFPTDEISSNVVRDRQGFIWVGTENGLVRYDGYACKTYRSFSSPANALALHIDSEGRLWIGTYASGLSLFDPMSDRFINFLPRHNDSTWIQARHITSICEGPWGGHQRSGI